MFTVGILICSDKGSRGERVDQSGVVIRSAMTELGASIVRYEIVPDDELAISATLKRWADEDKIDLILTSGGTGLSPRDHTPEATLSVIDRQAPGISEAIRAESLKKTPRAMLSRGIAGTRGRCLIINLPGSPIAVQECLDVLIPTLPHGIEILTGKASECARDRDH
ncbi:MAG: MogA/MoaB family molybdenum cofactor biosynthesis protein [Chloroflexota bacterium]